MEFPKLIHRTPKRVVIAFLISYASLFIGFSLSTQKVTQMFWQ